MTYVFCHRRPKGIKYNRKCKSSQPKQVNDRAVQLFEEVRATKLPINGSKLYPSVWAAGKKKKIKRAKSDEKRTKYKGFSAGDTGRNILSDATI